MMSADHSHAQVIVNDGVEIHVEDHGPPDGVPVLLIHGWPDTAKLWRNQVPALVEAGYRVIVPDVRGYGRSAKPTDVAAYSLATIGSDFAALFDHFGISTANVVGHDWGSGITWYLGLTQPHRVRSMVTISVGHPTAFREAGFRQLEKSWYTLLFQFEGLAETWLMADDWKNLRAFTGDHQETSKWIADLEKPGALTASLGPYRANMGPRALVAPRRELPLVQAPVMGVWSSRDMALVEQQMTGSGAYVAGEWRYERIDDVGHWIPLDAPDTLNALLLDWLAHV